MNNKRYGYKRYTKDTVLNNKNPKAVPNTLNMKLAITSIVLLGSTDAFLTTRSLFDGRSTVPQASPSLRLITTTSESSIPEEKQTAAAAAVSAPLKYLGPYPALGLRFPNVATASQRERNVSGVSLDFILDTAANTNTINARVAKQLGLEVFGSPALPGLGAAGALAGGDTFLLGDAELEGVKDRFIFMKGLTAAALPVASPASAGLLSLSFLQSFDGGVEFAWGNRQVDDAGTVVAPSVTFYDEAGYKKASIAASNGSQKATIKRLPVTLLPSVTVNINGIEMPALFDTGSPITVMNAQAAKVAGVEMLIDVASLTTPSMNPFVDVDNKWKVAEATSRRDILTLASSTGQPVYLTRSKSKVTMGVVGDDSLIDFGSSPLYVGDLPGLAALNGIGNDSPPAVVLGMDMIRMRSKMLFRAQQNEVYFSK